MKKTPTIFDRDWNGDRSRVVDVPHKDCGWVFAGEGRATRKIDGTCCLVRDGRLYKRRELKPTDATPADFELADHNDETGKRVGWMPVTDGPEDARHREAFADGPHADGTYELIGPKVQGNPEHVDRHMLVMHGMGHAGVLDDVPRTFDGLKSWMANKDIEGIVWHHPDGRMAKVKLRDFGLKRAHETKCTVESLDTINRRILPTAANTANASARKTKQSQCSHDGRLRLRQSVPGSRFNFWHA